MAEETKAKAKKAETKAEPKAEPEAEPKEIAVSKKTIKIEKMGALFTPEAIIMMTAAGALDMTGLAFFLASLAGIGIPGSFILDLAGLLIIGPWMLFRSGSLGATKGTAKMTQKALQKLGLGFLGELIPFFGDIACCWTVLVYHTLTT